MATSTEDKIFNKLDDLADRMARLETNHANAVVITTGIQTDVKNLLKNGCAKGEMQDQALKGQNDRLSVIEQRPERVLTIISVVGSILASVAAVMAWVHGK